MILVWHTALLAIDRRRHAPASLSFVGPPVENLAAYIIVLEQDELGVDITATLPSSVTAFAVPNGFLRPDTEYKLAIGTVTDDGNTSFVETTFTTAAGE